MKRIYHRYENWEEVPAGMWSKIPAKEEADMLQRSIVFTGDAELYGSWMLKVLDEWPISCENSLSATDINRKAWVGHAACCLAIGCPEYITRSAWGELSFKQQTEANLKAENAIKEWERRQRLKIISEHGKNVVTWMAYPTQHPTNWRQQDLFQHTGEYAGQSLETICV